MNNALLWWSARERREQWLLGILASLLVVMLYSFGIIKPLYRSAAKAKEDYSRALEQSGELQSMAARVQQAGASQIQRPQASLADIETAAQGAGLAVQSAVRGSGGVWRLVIEDASAAPLTKWITALPREFGVRIELLQIQRSAPGLVSATLTLQQVS